MGRRRSNAVYNQQDHPAQYQHDSNQQGRLEKDCFDEVMRQNADHDRWQKGQKHGPDEPPRLRIMRRGREDRPKPRGIDRQDRQHRAQLDHDLKGPSGAFETQKMTGQQKMPGRRYGDELCQPLQQTQKGGDQSGRLFHYPCRRLRADALMASYCPEGRNRQR